MDPLAAGASAAGTPGRTGTRPGSPVPFRLAAIGLGCLAALALGELGLRFCAREWRLVDFRAQGEVRYRFFPAIPDPRLGWVPDPDPARARVDPPVHILPGGLRSNGAPPPAGPGAPLLAVGDSFTFGNQVGDSETWPAQLEARLARPVLNAGVGGYGLDQAYLRALELLEVRRPGAVVLSFIPDDIRRCGFSRVFRGAKPWFELVDGRPVLRAVGPTGALAGGPGAALRTWPGYSLLVHTLGLALAPETWGDVAAPTQADRVARLLLADLEGRLHRLGIPFAVLVQPPEPRPGRDRRLVDRVLAGLDRSVTTVVDLRAPLAELVRTDPARATGFFQGHMTPEGNRWVARLLADALPGSPGRVLSDRPGARSPG